MELPTVFQETENKKEHVYDLKQPLSNTSAQPTTVTENSLQMVAEGGGQQFKISVAPLSKTLQGPTMAALVLLNSAGQQLCTLQGPSVLQGSGVGVGSDHSRPRVPVKVPGKLTKQQRVEKENLRAEALIRKQALLEERRLKKEKEEREKQERREKREAERKRKQEEQQLKLEAKKRKEEERLEVKRKREEEKMEAKKKKEEEKLQLQLLEQEKIRKKNLSKQLLMNFLSKKDDSSKGCVAAEIPPHTNLPRQPLKDTTAIDKVLQQQSCEESYLQLCKTKRLQVKHKASSQPVSPGAGPSDSDVVIVAPLKPHYKLLQFHTNHRPAYFGTWRKRSEVITPRNPFKKDETLLDYAVDSDDEWEEEEPGESVSSTEDEGESGEDDEDDDGFFVPHGYLSDGEGEISDGEGGMSHDDQKQMAKTKAWEAEIARKCQPLKPIKIGLVWERDVTLTTTNIGTQGAGGNQLLAQYTVVSLVPCPILISCESKGEATPTTASTGSCLPVPDEAMPDLVRLVHKSPFGLRKLVKTFRIHWGAKMMATRVHTESSPPQETTTTSPQTPTRSQSASTLKEEERLELASGISKRKLEQKIVAIATKEADPVQHRNCWFVNTALLQEYGLREKFTPLKVLGVAKEPSDRSVDRSSGRKCAGGPGAMRTLKQFFMSPTQRKQQTDAVPRQLEIVPITTIASPAKKLKIGQGLSQGALEHKPVSSVVVVNECTSEQRPADCSNQSNACQTNSHLLSVSLNTQPFSCSSNHNGLSTQPNKGLGTK